MGDLPKLTNTQRSNVEAWKRQVRNILRAKTWSETEAVSNILSCITQAAYIRIEAHWDELLAQTNATHLLLRLTELFISKDEYLLEYARFFDMRQRHNESLLDYSGRFNGLGNRLFQIPVSIENALPPIPRAIPRESLTAEQIAAIDEWKTSYIALKEIATQYHSQIDEITRQLQIFVFTQSLQPKLRSAALGVRPLTMDNILSASSTLELLQEPTTVSYPNMRSNTQPRSTLNNNQHNQRPRSSSQIPQPRQSLHPQYDQRTRYPRVTTQMTAARPPRPICPRCQTSHPYNTPCPRVNGSSASMATTRTPSNRNNNRAPRFTSQAHTNPYHSMPPFPYDGQRQPRQSNSSTVPNLREPARNPTTHFVINDCPLQNDLEVSHNTLSLADEHDTAQNYTELPSIFIVDDHEMLLPCINGKLNGHTIPIIFDSGASNTILREAEWLRIRHIRDQIREPRFASVYGVSGETLQCIGETDAHLAIGAWNARITVTIVRGLDPNFLLGIYTMRLFGMILDMARNELRIDDHRIPFTSTHNRNIHAFAAHTIHLQNGERRSIALDLDRSLPDFTTVEYQPDEEINQRHLLLMPNIITRTYNGKIRTMIHHRLGQQPIRIRKGTYMGQVSCVSTNSIVSLEHLLATEIRNPDNHTIHGSQFSLTGTDHLTSDEIDQLNQLLDSKTEAFSQHSRDIGHCTLLEHTIDTGTNPAVSKHPYRTPHKLRAEMERQIQTLLSDGLIEPSNSPWRAPVLMVQKKPDPDGTVNYRMCIDFRALNQATKIDRYPIPRIDDVLDSLGGNRLFTTLDLASGYWQIPVNESDRPKTSFSTGTGSYQWKVLPFGLCNAPSTFQRLMESILRPNGMHKFTRVYIDDIIIYSPNFTTHLKHLSKVLNRLIFHGLKCRGIKCKFAQTSVKYLGHIISGEGIRADPQKTAAVASFKPPQNLAQLRTYLGLTGYYRRFCPNYAQKAAPLYHLTKKDVPFEWTSDCQEAFDKLQAMLTSEPLLALPNFALPFAVQCDASTHAMGAILSQNDEHGIAHPIAYTSALFNTAQRNYTVTEKECLSIIHAITQFRVYLYGARFRILSDHRPLKWLLSSKSASARLSRWALKLQDYSIEGIEYIPGKENANADALSRYYLVTADKLLRSDTTVRPDTIGEAQIHDPVTGPLIRWFQDQTLPDNPPNDFRTMFADRDNFLWRDNILYKTSGQQTANDEALLLVIPESLRDEALRSIHGNGPMGHYGLMKTKARARERYYWERMITDVTDWVRKCQSCATRKSSPTIKPPLHPIPISATFGDTWSIDVVGPLPQTPRENKFIICAIEHLSRWPEAWATPDATASTTAQLIRNEIVCRYGPCRRIISDHGTNFCSKLMDNLLKYFDIAHVTTSAYHPKSNGAIENFNRTLGTQLSMYAAFDDQQWDLHISLVLYSYRSSIHSSSLHSPYEVLFGRKPRLFTDLALFPQNTYTEPEHDELTARVEIIRQLSAENLKLAQDNQARFHDRNLNHKQFQPHDWVLCKRPPRSQVAGTSKKFQHLYHGPLQIVRQVKHDCDSQRCTRRNCGEHNYEIRDPSTGKTEVVNVERLKAFLPAAKSHLIDADTFDTERIKRGQRPKQRSPGVEVEVVEILQHRMKRNPNGRPFTEYQLKFTDGDIQWVREDDMHCNQLLKSYKRQQNLTTQPAAIAWSFTSSAIDHYEPDYPPQPDPPSDDDDENLLEDLFADTDNSSLDIHQESDSNSSLFNSDEALGSDNTDNYEYGYAHNPDLVDKIMETDWDDSYRAKRNIATMTTAQEQKHVSTQTNPRAPKRLRFFDIFHAFTTTLFLIIFAGDPTLAQPPRIAPLGPLLMCGHSSQGKAWTIGAPPNCTIDHWQRHDRVDNVAVQLYHKRQFSPSQTAYLCQKHVRTVTTRMGFFGNPSVLSDETTYPRIQKNECDDFIHTYKQHGLIAKGHNVYSTDDTLTIEHVWCCHDNVQSVQYVQIHIGEIFLNLDSKQIITTLNLITTNCSYHYGYCEHDGQTLIWQPQLHQECAYIPIGQQVQGKLSTRTTAPPSQKILSAEGQFIGTHFSEIDVCSGDNQIRLNRSIEGLLFTYNRIPRNWFEHRYNVHPPQQQPAITDVQDQVMYFINLLQEDNAILFHKTWSEICRTKQREYILFNELAQENPTQAFRALLNRLDVSAQSSGDIYFVWNCRNITNYTIRSHPQTCYRDLPILLDDDTPAFVKTGSREIITKSVEIKCHQRRHLTYVHDNKYYTNLHGKWHPTHHDPKEIRWQLSPLETAQEYSFNASYTFEDSSTESAITRISTLAAHYAELQHTVSTIITKSGFDSSTITHGAHELGIALQSATSFFPRSIMKPLILVIVTIVFLQVFYLLYRATDGCACARRSAGRHSNDRPRLDFVPNPILLGINTHRGSTIDIADTEL